MKVLLCLIFLLGLDLNQVSGDDWLPSLPINSYLDRNSYSRYYDDFNEREDGKDDDGKGRDHIYRPCSLQDLKCIRDFLIQKSICLQSYEPPLDPYILKKLYLDVPHANTSAIQYNLRINGFKTGRIEELYINKTSDTLILEVVFEELSLYSPTTKIIYYQKGKEPKVAVDSIDVTYKNLSLTLIVYHINDANHLDSHVYAFLSDPNTKLIMGPELEKPGEGINFVWRDQLNTSIKEVMVQDGPVFLAAYLNNRVCNLKRHLPYSSHDRE